MPKTTVWWVRFPDGEREYRTVNGDVGKGAFIRARGVLWEIAEIHGERTLLVTRVVDEAVPAAEPPTLPGALDDEPLTLEVMTVA